MGLTAQSSEIEEIRNPVQLCSTRGVAELEISYRLLSKQSRYVDHQLPINAAGNKFRRTEPAAASDERLVF